MQWGSAEQRKGFWSNGDCTNDSKKTTTGRTTELSKKERCPAFGRFWTRQLSDCLPPMLQDLLITRRRTYTISYSVFEASRGRIQGRCLKKQIARA